MNEEKISTMFSQRLRELREETGLSQKKLSENTSVSAASIGYYENGDREPGLDIAIEFAKYFGVSLDYIAGLEDHRPRENAVRMRRTADEAWRHIVIERAGVVGINTAYGYAISVNGEDILWSIADALREANPAIDKDDRFAARVRISIELLGDRQEAKK